MSKLLKKELMFIMPKLRRYCYGLTSSKEYGDDLLHNSIVKILDKFNFGFNKIENLSAYMYRLISNTWKDELRKKYRNLEINVEETTYNQIRSEDLPKKTLDLLLDEKPSFINQLLNYKIKLAPALGALAAIVLVISISFNSNKIINNATDPIHLMSEKNKNIVLAQLEDILQKDKNNLNGFISLSNTNIEYTESKSYVDKFGRNCKDITFDNFVKKDLIINSATFVKLDDGSWKVIKLEFEKKNSLGI